MGISGAVVGMLILLLSLVAQRRRPGALVGATVAVMVMVQAMFAFGYSQSESGRSDMRPLAEAIWSRYPGAEMTSYRPGRRGPEDLSIYLNRIVRPVEDLGVLGALDRPRVLVMYQREGEALPRPPMGWALFASTKRGRGWCHAFVLAGRGSGVAP
jgi:hypothetical protein